MSSQGRRHAAGLVRTERRGELEVLVFENLSVASRAAAGAVAAALRAAVAQRGRAVAMFAVGRTQEQLFATLVDGNGEIPSVPWGSVSVVQMDEYVGLPPGHPACFWGFLERRLLRHVRPGAAYRIGDAGGLPEEAAERAACAHARVLMANRLDVCVLGVGDNGHLAFCEPGSDRHDPLAARVVELDAATRAQARRSGQFSSEEELPRLGVTTTLPVLLGASSVLALCFGPRRAALLAEALAGPPREALPVSWLTELAGARLYLDTEAAALL